MPIYEYTCESCSGSLEVIQKINDPPLLQCPRCGQPSLQKKTSLNSFQLKGSGWYRDGYSAAENQKSTETTAKPAEKSKSETGSSAA